MVGLGEDRSLFDGGPRWLRASSPISSLIVVRSIRLGLAAGVCLGLAACSSGAHDRSAAGPAPIQTVALSQDDGLDTSPTPDPSLGQQQIPATETEAPRPAVVPEKSAAVRSLAWPAGGGLASWYGDRFHGKTTANGEQFDMGAFTAAHRSFPLPSYVRVTNVLNGRSIVVRVNDRGPYFGNRVIDVSRRTADVLGFKGHGVGTVKLDYVGKAPAQSDDRKLLASYQEFGRPSVPGGMQTAALAPVSDSELASEADLPGSGVYALASAAASRSATAVASTAKAAASTATAAARTLLPDDGVGESRRASPVATASIGQTPSDAYAATAYAPPQPLIDAPLQVAEPKRSRARVVAPQTEPVLAGSTPDVRPVAVPSAAPTVGGVDVASRIASTFERLGGSSVRAGGSVSIDAGR